MSRGTHIGGGRPVPGSAKLVMLLQMIVIIFLSSWIVEEYLNNIYLQAYVSQTFQAEGLIIVAVVGVLALGAGLGLFKTMRSGHKDFGSESRAKVPRMTPDVISSPTGSSKARSGPSDEELHPLVAALKAELSRQGSVEPYPEINTEDAAMPTLEQVPPFPPAPAEGPSVSPVEVPPVSPVPSSRLTPRTLSGVPSTVITGSMPSQKRRDPDRDKNQNSRQ